MKNKIILALVVGFALTLHAVTLNLSIVLTDREAKAIQFANAASNAVRTNQVPPLPALSNLQFAEKIVREVLQYHGDKAIEAERAARAVRYDKLTPAEQAVVEAALK